MLKGAQRGQSTTEYGLIIAIIGIFVMLGLSNVGNSLSLLFSKSSDALLESHKAALDSQNSQPIGSKPSATSIGEFAQEGKGFYNVVRDPTTGKFKLLTMTESTTPANITSIDGDQHNTLGSMRIAHTLIQRAEEESDPELKSYYQKLAEKAYYLGAVEGYMDKVPGMIQSKEYTNGNALKDIGTFKRQIRDLMNNPPPNMDNQTYAAIMPLAAEVYNIGQDYENGLKSQIKPDGSIQNFIPDTHLDSGPGSLLKLKPQQIPEVVTTDTVSNSVVGMNDLVTLNELQAFSAQVLSDNQVDSAPVEVTWTNAEDIKKRDKAHQKKQKGKQQSNKNH